MINGSSDMKEVKELVTGVLLGKFSCPECLSQDNLLVYTKTDNDGVSHLDGSCRTPSCKSFWTEQELKDAGVLDENFVAPKTKPVVKTAITKAEYKALIARSNHDTTMKDGSLYRSIKPETAQFYGHLYTRDSEGNIVEEYYPETKEGFNGELKSLRGYKKRVLPKDFGKGNIGITGLSNDFSGQHLFRTGGKYVVITGGEIDKLSVAQMLRDYQISRGQDEYDRTAVVSCTAGEGSLAKQCAANYDWLNSFDNIIFCGDSDEVGKAAVAEAVTKLPDDKIKIMTLSMKDANEMLVAGKHKQFISNYFDAKPLISTGIMTSVDAAQGVREHLLAEKITLPPQMHELQTAMRGGIKSSGAIVNIIGLTSIGKSFFSDTLLHHWIYHSPLVPTVLTIERTASELILDLYSYHIEQNLTWFEDGRDALAYLDREDVKVMCEDMLINEYGQPRFHIIDSRTGDIKELEKQLEKAMKSLGSRLFVLDVLTDVIRSLPLDKQEEHLLWQKQMKKEGAIFVNVLHTTKNAASPEMVSKKQDDVKDDTKFKRVSEYDILGSGTIPQSADINIVLNRNKMATDPIVKNTTYVDMPKCRGGLTGSDICKLYYDPLTRKQYDLNEYLNKQRTNF